MRPPARALLLAIVCVPLAVAQDAQAEEGPVRAVSDRPAFTGAVGVAGNALAWIGPGPTNATLQVWLADLSAGGSRIRLLTEVHADPLPRGGLQAESLAFDGRWVVWSDNRFGNYDLFGVDVTNGQLRRITTRPGNDLQVSMADGHLAWTRDAKLWHLDLALGGEQEIRSDVGSVPEPGIGNGLIAWTQPRPDGGYDIRTIRIDGTGESVLADGGGASLIRPRFDGTRAVWMRLDARNVNLLNPPDAPNLQTAAVGGAVQDLTTRASLARDPAIGAGWVAFISRDNAEAPAVLQGEELATGRTFTIPGAVSRPVIGDQRLAYVGDGGRGIGPVNTLAWMDIPSGSDGGGFGISWLLAGAGVILIVAGLLVGAKSKKKDDDGAPPPT